MPYLIDISVLVRLANTADAQYGVAARAIVELHRQRELLHICPQNLIEFRSVATRPRNVNGLGLSAVDTEAKASAFEAKFPMLEDAPDIYPTWKDIVQTLSVLGKQVHDARLVAVCHVFSLTHLLTFNLGHFRQTSLYGSGLSVIDPADV